MQVGANDHKKHTRFASDPGPLAVARGWQSLLIEPIPAVFELLRQRYATHDPEHTRLLNAAVCQPTTPGAYCKPASSTMYYLNTTSKRWWGSNHSDPRCVTTHFDGVVSMAWISEIASVRKHLYYHQSRLFAYQPQRCAACSQFLGRPLPPQCMCDFFVKHTEALQVPCFCLERAVLQSAVAQPVALLMVDAEGVDDEVLRQYPFDKVKTWRVAFETTHLNAQGINKAASLMMRHGFANVVGGLAAVPMSIWHHVDSQEVWNASISPT